MKSSSDKLLAKHQRLVHSDGVRVTSHTQREEGEWVVQTLMIEGCDAPFTYRRKQRYQSLKGARVNLTYYTDTKTVAGFEMEVMRVVRIKRN